MAAAGALGLIVMGAGRVAAAVCGDADGDGVVTASDGVRILTHADGGADACPPEACDLDRDGRVSGDDATLAFRRSAGLAIADHCGAGTIAGRLLVPPPPASTPRPEHEPNDGPGTAEVIGRIGPGGDHRLAGAVGGDDPFDAFAFAVDASVTLELGLDFEGRDGADLDLLIADREGGSASCEGSARGHEACRVAIGTSGPRRVDVVVMPAAGSADARYELTVRATAAAAPVGISPAAGAGRPLAMDPAVYRGDAPEIVPGEIIVQLATPAAPAGTARAALARTLAGAAGADALTIETTAPDGTVLLALAPASAQAATTAGDDGGDAKRTRAVTRARTLAVAARLAETLGVVAATPNRVVRAARVPRDPLFGRQWSTRVIGLPRAWDVTIGSPTGVVAVVDTGIRSDHPDLAGRLVAGFDFISDPARANDGDGIDPDPFDPGDRPREPERGSFHGTHVAGTIAAATDNLAGVAGVTWRTGVMPLRVLGIGGGSVFDVAQAIRYAAGLPNVAGRVPDERVRVINLSLTTSGNDPILASAVAAAVERGVLVVAAAGNTGSDGFVSPAGFAGVLAVAATDRLGAPARYSSFGAGVDLAAPGGDTRRDRDGDGLPDGILSTLAPGVLDYGLMQGTSMASAAVSGAAALLLGVPGGASARLLREVLLASADDRGAPGRDDRYGAGLLDADAAVRLLAGLPPSSEPILVLDTESLRLAADESTLAVALRNAGGAALVLAAPSATTDDGGDWLGATVEGASLRVTVDRDRVTSGAASGSITLVSNGGTAEIAVVVEVSTSPPEDIGPVTVQLRDPTAGGIVATTSTAAAQDYRYRFDGVAPGRYTIVAGVDRDGDGALCEVGEECGAYPERGATAVVELFGGAVAGARDFGLRLVLTRADTVP